MASRKSKIPTLVTSPRHGNASDELQLINDCFLTDGLAASANDELKLRHLWRKLCRTELSLSKSLGESATIREQTRDEMQAVESYVSHIRSLSEQRDKLSRQLEVENESLKQQVVQLETEKEAWYGEAVSARKLVSSEGLQQLSGAGVHEIVSHLLREQKRLQGELSQRDTKLSAQNQELERTKLEIGKLRSPTSKRQQLSDQLTAVEEAIASGKLDYDTVAEKMALRRGRVYKNVSLVEESYKEELKSLSYQTEEEKSKLKQEMSVQASQYEKEIAKLRQLVKSQSTSTETLHTTHEGHIKQLKYENESISKSMSSLKTSLENTTSDKAELERTVQRLKRELEQQANSNKSLIESEKGRVSSSSRQQTELKVQVRTAEDGCRRRDEMIKHLRSETATLQKDVEVLQESKKKLSTQTELFLLTEEKSQQKHELKFSTYEIEIEKLKHQVAHKEEVLMHAQDLNVSLQDTVRRGKDEMKGLSDKLELYNSSSSRINETVEAEVERLKLVVDDKIKEIEQVKEKFEEMLKSSERELDGLKRKLGEDQNVTAQIESESNELRFSLESAEKERDEAEEYNTDLLSRLSELENEKVSLNESLGEYKGRSGRRNMELECKISELNTELSGVKDANQLIRQEVENGKEEVSKLSQLCHKYKSELELLGKQLSAKSQAFDSLRDKHLHTEQELSQLKPELGSANQECRSRLSEVAQLSQLLATRAEEVRSFQEQAMYERRLAEEKIHKLGTTLATDRAESKKTIEFLEISKNALNSQVEVLNLEIDTLKRSDQSGKVPGLTSECDKLKLKLEQRSADVTKEARHGRQVEERNVQLELELRSVKQELSEVNSKLIVSQKTCEGSAQTLNRLEREVSGLGTLLNQRQQELDQLGATHALLSEEKELSSGRALALEVKLGELTDALTQLEQEHAAALGRQERDVECSSQLEQYKNKYSEEILDNRLLKKECGMLRESLDHFKDRELHSETQLSTFHQSIAEARSALKSERAKTIREHEKCKKWQSEYKTIQTTCDTMHVDIVSLLGRLSSTEVELETSNRRLEDRNQKSISKLKGSLYKVTEEKGRCEKSVLGLGEKIAQLQVALEKEHQWKETADESHQNTLRDKLQLSTRVGELESELHEKSLEIKMINLNINKLRKENFILGDKYREALECGAQMWRPAVEQSNSVEA